MLYACYETNAVIFDSKQEIYGRILLNNNDYGILDMKFVGNQQDISRTSINAQTQVGICVETKPIEQPCVDISAERAGMRDCEY